MHCEKCGSATHRDDAMNSRCNDCEHLVRQCICTRTHIRLGYHRISDDSVSSAYLTIPEFNERIEEIRRIHDIDNYWARDAHMNLIWNRFQ